MRYFVVLVVFVVAIVIAGGMDYNRELRESVNVPSPSHNFASDQVRASITHELTYAVCGAYSFLRIHEDGTYDCLPG